VEEAEVVIARQWYFKYISKTTDTDATVEDMMLAMGSAPRLYTVRTSSSSSQISELHNTFQAPQATCRGHIKS
jgi:hypothetical protein